jgi:hypothetical protein
MAIKTIYYLGDEMCRATKVAQQGLWLFIGAVACRRERLVFEGACRRTAGCHAWADALVTNG